MDIPTLVLEGNVIRKATLFDKLRYFFGGYTMPKTPNYTSEMVEAITTGYEEGKSLEDLAEAIGRSVKSVRAKLVREGIYKAAPKPVAKQQGPSKKDLLRQLEEIAPFDVSGFTGVTKEGISHLIAHFTD